jgi:hypothetical protein
MARFAGQWGWGDDGYIVSDCDAVSDGVDYSGYLRRSHPCLAVFLTQVKDIDTSFHYANTTSAVVLVSI